MAGSTTEGSQKSTSKIETLALYQLQIDNKIFFEPPRVVAQSILYNMTRFRAPYYVF